MLVTNDQGNIMMFQRAKKPGQKSTKVQLLLWFHFSTENFNCFCLFSVDQKDGGEGRDDLHDGGGWPGWLQWPTWSARSCLCPEVQENCIKETCP